MRANGSLLARLLRDRRGVTAVEFALIAPVVLTLLYGEYALCDALSAKRKLTITAHTIADLVARQSSVTSTSLSQLLNASAQVMAPYSAANTSLVVSELTTNASGVTTVTWSGALNATALTPGVQVQLPSGMAQNGASLIYATATYSEPPALGESLFGTITLSSQFYETPRITPQVSYSN